MLKFRHGISSIAIAASVMLVAPAFAQAEAPQGASVEGAGLGDIVVTARKVAERLQDVPVAVTAFDGAALERTNTVQLSDVSRIAPGLSIRTQPSNGAGIIFFTLRGQTQRSSLATTDPSIGVYVDGVYWARGYGINANLLDVSNVQVLRGPQGTLFGRNTTGGAILISTNDPKLDEFSGRISVEYGRFNHKSGTAIVNAPIVEGTVAARFAFTMLDDSGYVTNTSFPDQKFGENSSYAMRAKLLAQLSDSTSILLSYDAFREDRNPDTGELRYVTSTSSSNTAAGAEVLGSAACFADALNCGAVGRARIAGIIARYDGKSGRTIAQNVANQSETHTDNFTLTINQETPLGDLKLIGGYRDVLSTYSSDYDGSEVRITEFSGKVAIDQWSAEATLTGSTLNDRLTYAAGLFYFKEDGVDMSNFAALSAISPTLTRFNGVIHNKSIGVYGQASYKITDQLSFTGGLRWSQDKKRVVARNGTVLGTIFAPNEASFVCTIQAGCPLDRSGKFDGVSWTIGLDYKATPDVLVYAKAARAFRSGGVNLRETSLVNNLPPQAFKPERVTSYEGGIKADLLNKRLRINLGGYYQIVDDSQREFILSSVVGPRVVNTTVAGNAGRADYWGGEAEVTARIIDTGADRYTLSANAAYVKPKYKDYINPQNGFDKSREYFGAVTNWTISTTGTYEHEFEASTLEISATYSWDSGNHFSEFNFYTDGTEPVGMVRSASDGSLLTLLDAQNLKRTMKVHKSGTLDARAKLSFGPESRYEVAIWGRNILNDRAIVTTGTVTSLAINGVRRPPASYGVTGTVKF